jgi:hypothetical protein
MAEQETRQGGLMGTLKGKAGPLPVWGWLALTTGLLLAYYLWAQRKAGASGTATGSTSGSDVPQTVNQTTVNLPPDADKDIDKKVPPHGKGPTNHKPGPVDKPQPIRFVEVGGPHAKDDLQELAKSYGITEAELIKLNPGLKRYEGSKKPIPTRTRIKVPAKKTADA